MGSLNDCSLFEKTLALKNTLQICQVFLLSQRKSLLLQKENPKVVNGGAACAPWDIQMNYLLVLLAEPILQMYESDI